MSRQSHQRTKIRLARSITRLVRSIIQMVRCPRILLTIRVVTLHLLVLVLVELRGWKQQQDQLHMVQIFPQVLPTQVQVAEILAARLERVEPPHMKLRSIMIVIIHLAQLIRPHILNLATLILITRLVIIIRVVTPLSAVQLLPLERSSLRKKQRR